MLMDSSWAAEWPGTLLTLGALLGPNDPQSWPPVLRCPKIVAIQVQSISDLNQQRFESLQFPMSIHESEVQAKVFADRGEKRGEILVKTFANFRSPGKWPQEIFTKTLHIFHEGGNEILSPQDSGRREAQLESQLRFLPSTSVQTMWLRCYSQGIKRAKKLPWVKSPWGEGV